MFVFVQAVSVEGNVPWPDEVDLRWELGVGKPTLLSPCLNGLFFSEFRNVQYII